MRYSDCSLAVMRPAARSSPTPFALISRIAIWSQLTFGLSGRVITGTEATVVHGVVRSHRIHGSYATRLQANAVARAATPAGDSNTPTPRTPPVQETRAMIRGRDTRHTARDSSPPRYFPGGSR